MPPTELIDLLRDHDSLVRIEEQMRNVREVVTQFRMEMAARDIKRDGEFTQFKQETDRRISALADTVESLKMSRAQFIGWAGAISTVITIALKIFWPK